MFYGVLRGGGAIDIKSSYNGVAKHLMVKDEGVHENESPIMVESFEINAKINILKIKIKNIKSRIKRFKREYANIIESYNKGFISLSGVNEKEDAIKEAMVNLEELNIELAALENTLKSGKIFIAKKFIIRQFYVADNQVVNAGDNIVNIETVDKYLVDIKYDPVTIKGRIQDKEIKFKSLVTGDSGKATVLTITTPKDNDNTQGAKIASLLISPEGADLHQLLDTVFEITIND